MTNATDRLVGLQPGTECDRLPEIAIIHSGTVIWVAGHAAQSAAEQVCVDAM